MCCTPPGSCSIHVYETMYTWVLHHFHGDHMFFTLPSMEMELSMYVYYMHAFISMTTHLALGTSLNKKHFFTPKSLLTVACMEMTLSRHEKTVYLEIPIFHTST